MAKFASVPVAYGTATTVTASDTIATGLKVVRAVVVQLAGAPILTGTIVTGVVGDQAGAPAAGSFLLKSYMPTSSSVTTPIASTTTFGLAVNWVAFGD